MNVFLHFLSRLEFLYMRLLELRKFSCELRQGRQFARLLFRGRFPLYGIRQITNGHVTTIMYHFVPIVTTPVF